MANQGMKLTEALKQARSFGWGVEVVRRKGEIRVTPGVNQKRITMNVRKKDAPRILVTRIRKHLRGE